MDNTFIKNDLVERYVLNQLNDEELATFRGQLMFDEKLRKQVVETKMLMSSLATIANEGIIAMPTTPVTAPAATRSNTMLRAAMIAGVLLLAGMTYYFVSSSDTDTPEAVSTAPIDDATDEKTPTSTPQENSTEESTDTEKVVPSDETKEEEEKIFALNKDKAPKTASPQKKSEASELDEAIFSSPNIPIAKATKEENNTASFFEEEGDIGYGDAGEQVNHYIEDAINNNTTKSRMGIVEINDFENGKVLRIDKNGAVTVEIQGTIDTKTGNNKKYVFKLFDNDEDKFINNMPLDQKHLKPKFFGADKQPFTINSKIELKPGLYYFTIEEEIDDDQDMIYAGRFYVKAGKFQVKD